MALTDRRGLAHLAMVVLVALSGGCAGSSSGGAAANPVTTPTLPAVPWGDYAADVHTRIDALAAAQNCPALQKEFDLADENSGATRRRTGHNNADLMGYIDAQMRAAGCYR